MHPELETLLKALDAALAARGDEAERLKSLYEGRVEDAALRAEVRAEQMDRAVQRAYPRWVRAQQRPSALPPQA